MFSFLSDRDLQQLPAAITAGNSRLNTLPIILAGPILRHVSKDSITVWIATRESIPVGSRLLVYDEMIVNNQVPTTINSTPIDSTIIEPNEIRLGQHLYIYLLTCKLTATTFFAKNKVYGYDIKFSDTETLANYLDTPGGANGMNKVTYPIGGSTRRLSRPTFALTPDKLEQTNIIHASCRKPHAEGEDAFPLVGTKAIGPNIANASLRPHLLFLTGDQIYADDVADILLFMLDDASKALMGWVEVLPNVLSEPNTPFVSNSEPAVVNPWNSIEFPPVESPNSPLPISVAGPVDRKVFANLAPGQRQKAIFRSDATKRVDKATSGLTSDKAKSHLMRLGEYYAMYLFSWSRELWGDFASSEEAWQLMTGQNVPTRSATEAEKTRYFTYKSFSEEYDNIQVFKQGLDDVRRALANVPTYMICDDHEVTDDWFLNLAWSQRILGDEQELLGTIPPIPNLDREYRPTIKQNPLGARIIANAMSSYVAFQDWGNRPETYAQPASGSNLYWNVLNALAVVNTQTGNVGAFDTLRQSILPVIKISKLDVSGDDGLKDEKVLEPKIRLDYILQFFDESSLPKENEFQILVLDSRTMRGFSAYKDDHAPQLIRTDKLEDSSVQGDTPGVFSKLDDGFRTNIIVAPTPIFGKPFVEYIQYGQALGLLGINNRYKSIKPKATVDKDGDGFPDDKQEKSFLSKDREAWLFNEKSFAAILAQLCRFESLVILSGDVHYAFSMHARIWLDNRTGGNLTTYNDEKRCTVAQLVASACKNQDVMTRVLRITTTQLRWHEFVIWSADTQYNKFAVNTGTGNNTLPVKVKSYRPIELEDHDRLQSRANLLVRYAFKPIKDQRDNSLRIDGTAIPPLALTNPRAKASVKNQHANGFGRSERINVGYNNIGVVRFTSIDNGTSLPRGPLSVLHDILHGRRKTTHHEISLAPIPLADRRPGDS